MKKILNSLFGRKSENREDNNDVLIPRTPDETYSWKADRFFQMFERRKSKNSTFELDGVKYTINVQTHDELNQPNVKLLQTIRSTYQKRVCTYKAVFGNNEDVFYLFHVFKARQWIEDVSDTFEKWRKMVETLTTHQNFLKVFLFDIRRPYIGICQEFASSNLYEILGTTGELSSFESKVSSLCEICRGMIFLDRQRGLFDFKFPIFLSPYNIHFTEEKKVKIDCASFGFITGGEINEIEFQDPFQGENKNEEEKIHEKEEVKIDIFSFGLVMAVMITNEKLKFLESDDVGNIKWKPPIVQIEDMERIYNCDPKDGNKLGWYLQLMMKCYSSDVRNRPDSFDDILRCLERKDLSGLNEKDELE